MFPSTRHYYLTIDSILRTKLKVSQNVVSGQKYYGSPSQLQSSIAIETSMPTVTVRGFLNFRTTVDGTVIVFTPSPTASLNNGQSIQKTIDSHRDIIPTSSSSSSSMTINPTKVTERFEKIEPTKVQSSQQQPQQYPTGLVTVLGGTVVNQDRTTIYETKVIGTYISGKYAQILSSSTKIKAHDDDVTSPTVRPTMTYSQSMVQPTKIIKHHLNHHHHHLHHRDDDHHDLNDRSKPREQLFASIEPLKSRWAKLKDNDETNNNNDQMEAQENKSSMKIRRLKIIGSKRFTLPPRQSPRVKMNRFKLPPTQAEEMHQYHKEHPNEEKDRESDSIGESKTAMIDEKTKEKILENLSSSSDSGPVYHQTEPLEREEHSRIDFEIDPDLRAKIDPSKVVKEVQTITSEVTQHVEGNHLQVKTLTMITTIERTLHPTETDFDTHSIQPTLDLSVNNIEATSIPETPALVISRTYSVTERTMRTTVVPVFDGTATQSHTVTESFFIRKLITAYRTLPPGDMILIDSTSTSAFDPQLNTELINGTDFDDLSMAEQQTISPTSIDSNILPTEMPILINDFDQKSNGQQIEASLNGFPQLFASQQSSIPQASSLLPTNQLAQQFDLNNPLLLAAVLQNPQLAALYLGLQQMKQQATQYNTIAKPTSVMQTETLYNTKMVSYYDGRQTRSRTILEPIGTTSKLVQTFTTEVVPMMNPQYAMQQAQLQNMFATQLGGIMPQFQMTPTIQPTTTMLKTLTTVTDSTMTKSKVYTLVYNAFSTRYRTITSTSIVPTTVTTVLTETIQINPTTTATNAMSQLNFFG
ncbi:hypothetical protein SSS_07498 [Sarcoptes scabiei]|uniref:DUF4758 domain-containing protein n=1 Tax=Sarcoptes scabiei TaxID=52283 RepID=A0A834RAP7_SARSC|nr:hypothetical protein SSS_07498 [Sarcoptes scabiei]